MCAKNCQDNYQQYLCKTILNVRIVPETNFTTVFPYLSHLMGTRTHRYKGKTRSVGNIEFPVLSKPTKKNTKN